MSANAIERRITEAGQRFNPRARDEREYQI